MICKLCGGAVYTSSSHFGSKPIEIPINDQGDLNAHKRQAHPQEYRASIQKRKDSKAAAERAQQARYEAIEQAGKAASRPVVGGYTYPPEKPLAFADLTITMTYQLSAYNLSRYRYPDFDEFGQYLLAKAEMEAALLEAYNKGAPVPKDDVAKAQAAMDAAGGETR